MKGADEYYDLFKGQSQQIGRLFLQMHVHARGKCFEIFLLPEGVEIKGDRISGRDNVEVYGVISGQRGWTESYGWLHTGKWQDDFFGIVELKKTDLATANRKQEEKAVEANNIEKERVGTLLSAYH